MYVYMYVCNLHPTPFSKETQGSKHIDTKTIQLKLPKSDKNTGARTSIAS